MSDKDALLNALKELYGDNPEEFDAKLQQAKSEIELRDFTEVFHLMTCQKVHGNMEERGECSYYQEVELAGNEWTMHVHKLWTDLTGKFIKELIDEDIITERIQILDYLPNLQPLLKEAEKLKRGHGEPALLLAIKLFTKMLEEV